MGVLELGHAGPNWLGAREFPVGAIQHASRCLNGPAQPDP